MSIKISPEVLIVKDDNLAVGACYFLEGKKWVFSQHRELGFLPSNVLREIADQLDLLNAEVLVDAQGKMP